MTLEWRSGTVTAPLCFGEPVRLRLIPDWHRCWRFLSVQLIVLSGAVQAAVATFPDALRYYIPESYLRALSIALLAAAIVGRVIQQEDPNVAAAASRVGLDQANPH